MKTQTKFLLAGALAAGLTMGARAWVQEEHRHHVQGGTTYDGDVDIQAGDYHRFTLPFASSLNGSIDRDMTTETLVKVCNDSNEAVQVMIEWDLAFGGAATGGVSGPITIPPGESNVLSTLNFGEDPSPFIQSAGYRDATGAFSGHARVFVGPKVGSAKNVTCTAVLLTGLGLGQRGNYGTNAKNVTALHVCRADDADDDGIDDTRFKGD